MVAVMGKGSVSTTVGSGIFKEIAVVGGAMKMEGVGMVDEMVGVSDM